MPDIIINNRLIFTFLLSIIGHSSSYTLFIWEYLLVPWSDILIHYSWLVLLINRQSFTHHSRFLANLISDYYMG